MAASADGDAAFRLSMVEFDDDPKWSSLAVTLGIVGLAYVVMAAVGLAKVRDLKYFALPLTFVILRSLFLGTLENPEPRYTLECYPVVILLASIIFRSTRPPTVILSGILPLVILSGAKGPAFLTAP